MSPRNREQYLAEREAAVEAARARAAHRYFRAHITPEVGQILKWVRALRLGEARAHD